LLLSSSSTINLVQADDNNLESTSSEQFENAYRYNVQGWIYVHTEGEPYDRGYQQGYLLAAEIIDMMNRWSNIIHNYPKFQSIIGDASSPRYEKVSQKWWNFCKSKAMKMYWSEYPDEYKEEIKGIADGVNAKDVKFFGKTLTYEDILTLNEMYEVMTKFENPKKGIHPLKTFLNSLRQIVPGVSEKDENEFISTFISLPKAHHCNGFIATGDATTDGQIVASQGVLCGNWWYSYYIAQRWNVILDIAPSEGNRIIMTTSPGYIWSDENFYQNSNGIILIDTTTPQGLWTERGLPFAIRTRTAAQYSNSIDDVIYHMLYKNDGVWTAVLVFGDTKTGEIGRLDLGLYKYKIWRTFNGFYWSANNLMDPAVRAETNGLGIKGFVYLLATRLLKIPTGYQYYTRRYFPSDRDTKFEELGNKYYGEIDTNVVKEIMSTKPIFNANSVDCKITDSTLIKNNGLWTFFGYQNGAEWNVTKLQKTLKGVKNVPAAGWLLTYGLPYNFDYQLNHQYYDNYGDKEEIFWDFTTDKENNIEYSHSTVSDDTLYSTTSSGMIYAIDTYYGDLLWDLNLSGKSSVAPVVYNNTVFVGTNSGLYALDKNNGDITWMKKVGAVSSLSIACDEIIAGTEEGIYSFSCNDGSEKWESSVEGAAYISKSWRDTVFVGSDNSCYAVDAENGETKWILEMDAPITSCPTVNDGTVYAGCWDTYLYAINAEDGELKWRYKTGWGIDTSPAVSDSIVYFGSMDNNFYALDAESGDDFWIFTCQASIHSSPAVYGEYVFFGSDDGRFYALNKTTGEPEWFFTPGYSLQGDVYNYITTPIISDPVANNSTIFIGANGVVFALDAQTCERLKTVSEKFELPLSALVLITAALIILGVALACLYFARKTRK